MITDLPIATTVTCQHCPETVTLPGFCGEVDELLMRLETEHGWYWTGRVGDIAIDDADANRLLCPAGKAERDARLDAEAESEFAAILAVTR